MRDPVLAASTLRAIAFSTPGHLPLLLEAMHASAARVPVETYNCDEDADFPEGDIGFSAVAREVQTLRHRVQDLPWPRTQRESAALRRAEILAEYVSHGLLVIDPLSLGELRRREALRDRHGIGRGEAASLVLASRHNVPVAYFSPDDSILEIARCEGVAIFSVPGAIAA